MELKLLLINLRDRMASLSGNFYKTLFLICAGLALIIMPILSFDSGITDDERLHEEHGIRIKNYYLHGDTLATTTPFDQEGNWRIKNEPFNYVALLNIYGGFFDYVAALVYSGVTHRFMGEYESKHMLSSLTGWGLMILIGLIAYRLTGSWAAALIGLILTAVSPRIIGHSLCNPKDIPFALGFGCGMYQILRTLQEDLKLGWMRIVLLIITFIIAIDTRVGGVILLVFLVMFAGLYIIDKIVREKLHVKQFIRPVLVIIGVCIVSYFGCSLFWPFAGKNPLLNPIRCLNVFSAFSDFNSYELFEGHRINATEIPWYFVPKWLYISFPPVVIVGLLLVVLYIWKICAESRDRILTYGLMIFSVAFPLVSIIIKKSNIYDDARHLYFLLPSVISLAAVGWYYLLRGISERKVWYPTVALFTLMAWEPFGFMLRNHPNEAMYFSPFIGGTQGAFKNYEMDYWGFSLRSGLNWIEHTDSVQVHGRKTKVRLWYGEQMKIKYYCDKSKHLEYVLTDVAGPDWDYTLALPAESKKNEDILYHWPPPGTVHQIMADGAPLCAIVRNAKSNFGGEQQPAATNDQPPATGANSNSYLVSGIQSYNAKDYNKAIVLFKRAVEADSTNQMAWNNIIATYNTLQMYEDAIEVANKGIQRFPTYDIMKNNRKISVDGLSKLKVSEAYYSSISYNYFAQADYANCVKASIMLLKYNPKSVTAYNNMCASYNALGKFQLGKEACEKGLQLDPREQLLKNNLKISKNGLGQ